MPSRVTHGNTPADSVAGVDDPSNRLARFNDVLFKLHKQVGLPDDPFNPKPAITINVGGAVMQVRVVSPDEYVMALSVGVQPGDIRSMVVTALTVADRRVGHMAEYLSTLKRDMQSFVRAEIGGSDSASFDVALDGIDSLRWEDIRFYIDAGPPAKPSAGGAKGRGLLQAAALLVTLGAAIWIALRILPAVEAEAKKATEAASAANLHKDHAKDHAVTAAGAADKAGTAKSDAEKAADASATSETLAAGSALAAQLSAGRAGSEKDVADKYRKEAKDSADKASVSVTNANEAAQAAKAHREALTKPLDSFAEAIDKASGSVTNPADKPDVAPDEEVAAKVERLAGEVAKLKQFIHSIGEAAKKLRDAIKAPPNPSDTRGQSKSATSPAQGGPQP